MNIATKGKDKRNIHNHFLSPKTMYEKTKNIEVERKYPALKIVRPYKIIRKTNAIDFL